MDWLLRNPELPRHERASLDVAYLIFSAKDAKKIGVAVFAMGGLDQGQFLFPLTHHSERRIVILRRFHLEQWR